MKHIPPLLLALLLAGCGSFGLAPAARPTGGTAALAGQWYAPPLPHNGQPQALSAWWRQWGDPLLVELIDSTQQRSPTVAAARAQVAAARASLASADSAAGPQLAAVANASRGQAQGTPLGTSLGAGLQASWALDVWGQSAGSVRQAQAQQSAAVAGWHEARVLVAAEAARLYHGYRACRAQLAVSERDGASRQRTAQGVASVEKVGLIAPATLALARASSADAQARVAQQGSQCEQQLKALVALTGQAEPALRERLQAAPPAPEAAALQQALAVGAVPAEVIRQRPDVARAQYELLAASAAVGVARAALWPSLSLSGSWLRNRLSTAAGDSSSNVWSVGPLTLNLPLLGRAGLNAAARAAQERYESAAVAYAATLRQAVAEVEQALVALSALQRQQAANREALLGYSRSFRATEARFRVGLASLNELEEARRLQLNADSSAVALQLEQVNAWIALYVALGGGYDPRLSPEGLRNPS